MRADFTHVLACQGWSLRLCVGNGVCCKNQAIQLCAQVRKRCGGCKGMPQGPCGQPLPLEGGKGGPMIGMTTHLPRSCICFALNSSAYDPRLTLCS